MYDLMYLYHFTLISYIHYLKLSKQDTNCHFQILIQTIKFYQIDPIIDMLQIHFQESISNLYFNLLSFSF
jgi:hypothetical protein